MLDNQSIINSYFTATTSRCKYPPGLYLVATPIGNLEDITIRALYTLRHVDKVLCEDTRVAKKLLGHYGIHQKLISFHDHSTQHTMDQIINDLKQGQKIALISDAGTPLINDPGFELVKHCAQHNIYTTIIPGPCALIAGLALSTLPNHTFMFGGFLPVKSQACQGVLRSHLNLGMTIIYYETAQRLLKTLALIHAIAPGAQVAVIREITKLYETVMVDQPQKLYDHFSSHPIKGEIVLVINPAHLQISDDAAWQQALKDALKTFTVSESVKLIAQTYGVAKNQVYRYAVAQQEK